VQLVPPAVVCPSSSQRRPSVWLPTPTTVSPPPSPHTAPPHPASPTARARGGATVHHHPRPLEPSIGGGVTGAPCRRHPQKS
jgi:hypothetical protein